MNLDLLRLLAIFGVGYVTWLLALLRTFATIKQQAYLLYSLIFIEEVTMILTGMWLARCGTVIDAISCALGGVLAAYTILRVEKRRG